MAVFVGRERELRALDERLDEALAIGGQVVLVSGEPGVGKTRLVEELSRRAAARGFVVVWGDRGKRREHRRTTPGCRPFDGCAGRSVLSSSGHAPTARSSRSCSTTYAEPRLAILTKRASASATPSLSSCVGQPRNSREDKQNKRCCRQRPRFRASHRPRSSIRRYRPGETHQSCNRAAGARPPPAHSRKRLGQRNSTNTLAIQGAGSVDREVELDGVVPLIVGESEAHGT
jgi:AAA ATPase domain